MSVKNVEEKRMKKNMITNLFQGDTSRILRSVFLFKKA